MNILESVPWFCLNWLINFNDNALPVPSYPVTVLLKNTKYGPNNFFTIGNGIAAASSITTSSAWANFS